MLRIPWSITRLAGLIVILSLVFDPFLQQLVNYPTRFEQTAASNATLTRGVTYTMDAPDQDSSKLLTCEKTKAV